MSKRIYIDNLPLGTIDREVHSLFKGAKIRSIHLKEDGESSMSAIIMIEDDHTANRYVSSLKGKLFKGRKLNVKLHM